MKTLQSLVRLTVLVSAAVAILTGCSSSDTKDLLPDVSVSVTALNFQVTVDEYQLQTVTVKNLNSRENVVLERITSTNEVFRVGGYFTDGALVPLETPITVEGNGARTIYIAFYPVEVGRHEGKLVVESRDSDDNPETDLVTLTGFGQPEAETEDD
ncbi:hypothetical protein CSB45_11890 [candidate division KSB3 bacterium]|uniref:Cep192/Spd-2-like domain-containing protein n=1 Tax=candidate division KSB3 bacterium TaxID=2044937 RepID=A0A2G6E3N7_9BACT|nr:MAG: hypothetical protein CSB45_11890 [candidate division KSB3 bacterium]PIE29243.1 MAG: hypothetical protein CSA57_09560 [candidate division KSB3 bacterium]